MKHWQETREVLERLAGLRRAGVPAALATVVRVRGSAYRREGAKMVVAADGSSVGNVSGGCLEADVREVALQVIRDGHARFRSYCSGADEVEAWDLGVGCEGQVEVFVEPAGFDAHPALGLLEGDAPFAVCSLVEEGGGGGERLVLASGASTGGLGAAELNVAVAELARASLGGRSGLHEVAGRTVFVDLLSPPPRLVVVGAGDDARPLARLALTAGFRVVVVDRRPGLLTAERFPDPVRRVGADAATLAERVGLDAECYAVLMNHHYADDQAYLRALVHTPVAYIGLLGPRQRTERMLDSLLAETPHDTGRVHGPVGLDLGADGAEQVALSILAEILAVRAGRAAGFLRERRLPIHALGG